MNKDLLRLRKQIKKITTLTRELQVCRALQTIFHDKEVGLTDKEAFTILGWDYSTREELFGEHNAENINVSAYENCESFILNTNQGTDIPVVPRAIVVPLSNGIGSTNGPITEVSSSVTL